MTLKINIRASPDDKQKRSLAAELMLHIACKKCFYGRLKEIPQDPNTVVTIIFNHMQNNDAVSASSKE
jgi:hypothetical protein